MALPGESVPTGGETILVRVQLHAAGIGPVEGLGAPTVLRQRARDAVLEYRVAGQEPIIAKCYAEASDVIAAERALHLLASRGFDAPASMRVPAVVGCFPDSRVLLMRRADGVPLPALVRRAADWVEGVRAAGRWLAQLHLLESREAPRLAAEAVAERLRRRVGRAAALRPESADALSEHLTTVLARSGGASIASTLTHGRFHPGHVFVDR